MVRERNLVVGMQTDIFSMVGTQRIDCGNQGFQIIADDIAEPSAGKSSGTDSPFMWRLLGN